MGRYSLNGPPGNLTFVAGGPADLDTTSVVTNPKNNGAAEKNAQRQPEGVGYDSKGESTALGVSFSDWQDLLCAIGSKTTATHDSNRSDLLPRIKGLFRLLDLYSEAGSGGLVDKIIISQESLGRFINSVLPGAYTNITKIDFARLDREASLRLVGIYGSKSEIVRFLFSLGSIDVKVAALLLVEDDVFVNMRPSLRSGIYILSPAPQAGSSPNVRYVIYWPEGTTWNDDATGSVRKNRVTFMRYLTSLTDQIRALVSSEHEAELVFQDVDQDDDSDWDGSEMSWNDSEDANVNDRLFKFEVAKTNEQEEAVNVRAGFTVPHPTYCLSTANIPTSRGSTRQMTLIPQFVDGETTQAVATTRFVPGVDHTHRLDEAFSQYRFNAELKKYGSVIISPSVDATGFGILLDSGNLKARDRAAYETYCSTVNQAEQRLSPGHIEQAKHEATSTLRKAIEAKLLGEGKQPVLTIHDVKPKSAYRHWGSEFVLKASYSWRSEPSLEISVWALDLSEDDRQTLKENPWHVPTPRMPRSAKTFSLPLEWRIRRLQILGQKKALLIVDCPDKIRLWLFSLRTGFSPDRPTCNIPNILGRQYVVAVDQHARLVALIMTEPLGNVTLQEYLMDETFSTMYSRGSPLSLNTWYTDGTPEFAHASFFNGTEELCLVEVTGRVRVLLIPSRSFRPASIHLRSKPLYVRSSPDGAALVIVEGSPTGTKSIRVFHRASFGSNENGIVKELPESFNPTSKFSITSTGERQKVFLMAFDVPKQRIISAALAISCKETEYRFRATDEASNTTRETTSIHNSLINCFSEVWERFPVAAAIQRQTLSEDGRENTSVTFVSSLPSHPFKSYFKRMMHDFEKLSCKLTDQRLSRILVMSSPFDEVFCRTTSTSRYKAGEWIAELLCLIPIHIAVTSENRFIPLKDGVLDSTLERELLGAEVSKIIDSISLGWYQSIFSSYMASKPVKVVSSMGEQSVGKSYSLNHMVDTSFAGSAVRTTEGVWLSVCPRKDCLVVALDFEGVHSIERTPQEDMLLVLFNTALSNLVIFRSNFALSRDVANMFTSFQASTHLFDPSANPRLFKGLLTVVIKDVVDGDKKDIVKEFFAQFSQIVSREQATNFITVLHNGKLTVIPWSVIQSREFYTLFSKLRNLLFGQKSTHGTAGEFLITLKTLMAKMKAQDWGSLDQTVIKHRVAALSDMLPAALEHGRSGSSFDAAKLRNLDDQSPIDHSDHKAHFYVGKDEAAREETLASLLAAWVVDPARGSVEEVATHLNDLATSRIAHVKAWIEQNLSRFPADNADIRSLRRDFEDFAERLRNAVRLCPAQCSTCQLQCMLNQSHQHQAHDCRTSHSCTTPCEYSEEHDQPVACQLPAGHNGKHVCNPTFHLCGEPCHLAGRKGCQNHCTKPSDHEEGEHACSAKVHHCGGPCDLRNIMASHGQKISCPLLCAVPHDEPHKRHACENRMVCLIGCELCQAYCASGDHFHALDDSLPHLCEQEHRCRRQCEAAGVCEINTTPLSVETTLTGKHSKFSYTKYTQRAKRLDCAITIPPGILAHDGQHICKTDADPFHYCEESCPNCGHICTLPLGHWQPEHDTAHGSMERTAWAVEGNSDAAVEFQGRKFTAQGNGALHLCSSICRNLGRHAHIDYCRNAKGQCQGPESEHIDVPMLPNRNRAKDWVSHEVFWARTGFKDPYSNDEQADFGKCDVQCAGPEHQATATAPAQPSFCTLPIFHPPHPTNWQAPGNSNYVSADGHSFGCPNPNNLRQAFHVIFVLDKSRSMTYTDRRPLQNQPVTACITRSNNNRFGAVLSAVYGFWITRGSGATGLRRDAYSVITFESYAQTQISNDSTSTSDQLLDRLVQLSPDGGTDFDAALKETRTTMVNNWSTDRSPVVVFLSDGECWVNDNTIYDLCNEAVSRGKPVSFHAVSFGQDSSSTSLRRMVTVAERVAQDAPRDPLAPVVPCSYSDAMDTIRLAETFINIADSLKKPRAALLRA